MHWPCRAIVSQSVLPWGFFPYDVSEMWASTCTGFASPGSATSSGFLCLVTSCSALIRTAFFQAESVHGVEALRGFPLPVAATAFAAPCPSSGWFVCSGIFGRQPEGHASVPYALRAPLRDSCIWKVRSRRSGVTRLRRSILSQPLLPSEGSCLPSSLGPPREGPPLMGFPTTLDESVVVVALQSFKEPEAGESLSRSAALPGVCVLGWCDL